jgi:hypothetical protein
MATRTLGNSYLMRLTNANHDGVTQQIDDRLQAFETDNAMLVAAVAGVHQARLAEDAAYRRFSGKDFASDDLKAADQLEDKYMSTVHAILNSLLYPLLSSTIIVLIDIILFCLINVLINSRLKVLS